MRFKPDGITDLGSISLAVKDNVLGPIIFEYKRPLIPKDVSKLTVPLEDIENSPNIQNPAKMFASYNSDIIIPEGTSDVVIRGSRPGDVILLC